MEACSQVDHYKIGYFNVKCFKII